MTREETIDKIRKILLENDSDGYLSYDKSGNAQYAVEIKSSEFVIQFLEPTISDDGEKLRMHGYYCLKSSSETEMQVCYEVDVVESNEHYFSKEMYELTTKIAQILETYYFKL